MPNLIHNQAKVWRSILLGIWLILIWPQPTHADPAHLFVPAQQDQTILLGDRKSIGKGFTQAWLVVDQDQQPVKIGVTLDQAAIETAPASDISDPGQDGLRLKLYDGIGHSVFEYEVKLPEYPQLPFTHVTVDWNPFGHAPQSIFTAAHWDIHFYTVPSAYRQSIQQETPAQIAISDLPPPPGYLPADYQIAPGTAEPRMGSHCADFGSPQLRPGKFDNTFIFGVHNGKVIFWEPMIANQYLNQHKAAHDPIKLPQRYQQAGYYPTTYGVEYDPEYQQFAIFMDDFHQRQQS